ncbi:MAG: alpha-glucan family phosphorylase, partial [Candidatus Omnitrophica bacterium]|nr:alpha-glucan family phosphorylase [Candidatus Omnitrophota bacterium]
SRLHGQVARAMWKPLYPGVTVEEVPIEGIVNAVHTPYWQTPEIAGLFAETSTTVRDEALWEKHLARKRLLLDEVKRRLARRIQRGDATQDQMEELDTFDPEALTIGFARRFAPYKRPALLFEDVARLIRVAARAKRTVQLIFAGKAHPRDKDGQDLIAQIHQHARNLKMSGKVKLIFVEEYDIDLARLLVSGVDVWLNNPERPREASGTSGMKAATNGALNLSTPDGWAVEGLKDGINGWLFGVTDGRNDFADAEALYAKLGQIIDLYDNHRDTWLRMMNASIASLTHQFGMERMLGDYVQRLYSRAVERRNGVTEEQARRLAAQRLSYRARVLEQIRQGAGQAITLERYPTAVAMGASVPVSAVVDLKGLAPEDVGVDLVISRDGEPAAWHGMHRHVEPLGEGRFRFSTEVPLSKRGDYHLRVRVAAADLTAWQDPEEAQGVVAWSPAKSAPIHADDPDLLRYRSEKTGIPEGMLFYIRIPSEEVARVSWVSAATNWGDGEGTFPLERVRPGSDMWVVVVPKQVTGLGYHEFKFMTRLKENNRLKWLTGTYPVAPAEPHNAWININEDTPFFSPAKAQERLASIMNEVTENLTLSVTFSTPLEQLIGFDDHRLKILDPANGHREIGEAVVVLDEKDGMPEKAGRRSNHSLAIKALWLKPEERHSGNLPMRRFGDTPARATPSRCGW